MTPRGRTGPRSRRWPSSLMIVRDGRTGTGAASPDRRRAELGGGGGQALGSIPTEDPESGRAWSRRRACPPPPSVASTRTPAAPAGTARRPCRPSPAGGGTVPSSVSAVSSLRCPPSASSGPAHLQPPGQRLSSGCLPDDETEAGGVGAVHLAGRETPDERSWSGSFALLRSSSSSLLCGVGQIVGVGPLGPGPIQARDRSGR